MPPGVQNRRNPDEHEYRTHPKNAEALPKYAALAARAQKKAISSQFVMKLLLFLTFTLCAVRGMAQMPNPYGPSINLENAKKAVAPAVLRKK